MTNPRDLIQRLADSVELLLQMRNGLMPLSITETALAEARAYLAAPDEPAVPSDAELLELMPEAMRDEFSYAATVCSDATGNRVKAGIFRVALNTVTLEYARAVLARYGNRTPAPIPLSERYPNLRPDGDDFSKDGCLWWYEPRLKWRWGMQDAIDCIPYPTHWLPHWALPVPGMEA